MSFIGRKTELGVLNQMVIKKTAKLLVLTGRRRVGKSKLLSHYGQNIYKNQFYKLVGMPPQAQNRKAAELNNLATQIAETFDTIKPVLNDWTDALFAISSYVKDGNCLLLIDEINWFGKTDDNISGSLFTLWESKLQYLPNFTLILSGSLASWIDQHFLNSQAWYGRIAWEHVLQPMPLPDALKFIPSTIRKRLTPLEQLRYLMVSGGIPSYLLAFDYALSLENNLTHHAFTPGGYFFNEYERLLNDLYKTKGNRIRRILEALSNRKSTADEIAQSLGVSKANGHLYDDLQMMIMSGFVQETTIWDFTTLKRNQRNRQYTLSDPYLRFYLKCIEPNRTKIQNGNSSLPKNLDSFLGLQFETVLRQNMRLVYTILGINQDHVLQCGPYQTKGLQIDLVVQTRRYLYIVEMKFQLDPLGSDVVRSMVQKLERFPPVPGLSLKTALIHVSGAQDSVIQSEDIDICENLFDHTN
jgi:AAA+ ATPase superfamily predicted ATPase